MPVVALAATKAPTFAERTTPSSETTTPSATSTATEASTWLGLGDRPPKVRLNNGAGAFGELVDYPVGGGNSQDIAAGDFNGDGRLDLVVTINNPQIGLSLLRGNGDGTFAAPVNFPNTSGFDSPAVAAVDLNNDGKLDVVIAHEIACYTAPCVATDLISVMIGNGDGTFQPSREIQVGRGMAEIAVGDYNRDGFKDLAIAGTQGQVYRLHGVGDGTFVQQPTLIAVVDPSFIPVTDIDVADFNGDSIQDLVVAVPHNGSRTAILIGNGDGTFRTPLVLTDPRLNLPQQQAVADYNGDGFQDLALSLGDGNFGLMQIRNGNGDGTFQAAVQYLLPPPTSSVGGIFIASANLNGDTKPDIVLNIGGAFPSFAVLLNSTGAAPLRRRGADAAQPGAGRDARATGGLRLDGRDRGDVVSHPDRRLEQLLRSARRRSGRHGVAVHRCDAQRGAAALVARARHQLGRHRRCLVLGPALHSAGRAADSRSPRSRSTRRASSAATPRRERRA